MLKIFSFSKKRKRASVNVLFQLWTLVAMLSSCTTVGEKQSSIDKCFYFPDQFFFIKNPMENDGGGKEGNKAFTNVLIFPCFPNTIRYFSGSWLHNKLTD